jgi:hypothetical protein
MKTLLLSLLTVLTVNAWAGRTTVRGISNIGQSPDYLELELNLKSNCYATAEASNKAIDELADKLIAEIESHTQSDPDNIILKSAGISERKDVFKQEYDPKLERDISVEVCKDGWFGSRKIVAKFSDVSLFEQMNPSLLAIMDTLVNDKLEAKIKKPIPRLLPETIRSMEDQALEEALVVASRKMQIMKRVCQLQNVQITDIGEAGGVARSYRDPVNSAPSSINFEDQYVHIGFRITFEFTNTSGSCQATGSLL